MKISKKATCSIFSLFRKSCVSDFTLPADFTYTAHSGCVNTPDNSIASIEAAAQYDADIVEVDLNFGADGQPVLSHDDPQGGEVTLDEAFGKISGYKNLRVNVDVKKTTDLGAVESLAKKHGIYDRMFFTGIRECDVDAVKKSTPGVPYYLNVDVSRKQSDAYLDSLVKKVAGCGAIGINFNKKNATQKLVDKFRDNGLLVSVWTANSEKDIRRILALSPDNITTRRPDLIVKILQNRNV